MITLNLPPEEEARLREAAARQGQEIGDYLLALARREYSRTTPVPDGGLSLAEALKGYIGVVDSRELNGGEMSDFARNSEEEFGKIMDEKKRQGHV